MGLLNNLRDAVRRKKSRDFAKELSNQLYTSPLCSDYENLFAQVRPLIDEMKTVMPYGVGRNGAKLATQRTPELELLKDPNDEMGWAEFADLMFSTWLTEDELDIHVWRGRGDKIIGYTVIPPQCRVYLGNGRWEWLVMTTDGMETLTEEDVMRLRFSRSPRDIERGVSPAGAVRVWAQIDDLISQYQKAYFENGAIPATITFITASTQEKYLDTRRELERKLKGAENHNKTVYAWRQFDNDTGTSVDQVEVKTIQGNNSTLAIRDIVDIINDRLNKSIGVSNFILGDDSSAKYDNAELSDHQFTKRRVYPALLSFWNQFQHELDRLTGGLGYGISFDLEIPELTERVRARAEIARIRGEALVNLISAGASGVAAVEALELPKNWLRAADGVWMNSLQGNLDSPISISYSKPKAAEATVDKRKCDHHHCDHEHSLDKLPEMTKAERAIYDRLVAMAEEIMADTGEEVDIEDVIRRITQVLEKEAENGAVDGVAALALLASGQVAEELAKTAATKAVAVSGGLKQRIASRASQLVRGYSAYTTQVMQEVLNNSEGLSASQVKSKLDEVLPRQRAELIARNETNYVIKSGRLEQDIELADKYSLQIHLVWHTSGDSNVCPTCEAMEGESTPLGKSFIDTVTTAMGKVVSWTQNSWNDDGMVPAAHVNCRCYFTEELD